MLNLLNLISFVWFFLKKKKIRELTPKKSVTGAPVEPLKVSIFQRLSEEEISKTYEEWMKIAADNVIYFYFLNLWFYSIININSIII